MSVSTVPADLRKDVLVGAAGARRRADAAEAQLMVLAARWADLHTVLPGQLDEHGWEIEVAGHHPPVSAPPIAAQRLVELAGPGTPSVAEFAIPEFAVAVGMSTPAARVLIGDALELRHRLPMLWRQVVAGEVPVWRARRVAERTPLLSPEAAAAVDVEVTPVVASIGVIRVQALVEAALMRFDPEQARQRAQERAENRHVTLDRFVSEAGTMALALEADAVDARAFDEAVAEVAARLGQAGDTRSLDVRRAAAVGILADPDTATTVLSPTPTDEPPARRLEPRRPQVTLYLHLSDQALQAAGGTQLGRLTRGTAHAAAPLTPETIRRMVLDWLGGPAGSEQRITVTPLVDQRERIAVDAYEIPDRLATLVRTRDETCVFPHCEIPAERCDLDHIEPYVHRDDGGPPGQTSSDNLAPLCRTHHRLKTHGGWTYRWVAPRSDRPRPPSA